MGPLPSPSSRTVQAMLLLGARSLVALCTVKVVSVLLGPAGTGLTGQFGNLMVVATTLAGSFTPWLVGVVARQRGDDAEVLAWLRSAAGAGWAVAALLVVAMAAPSLADVLLPVPHGRLLLLALALAVGLLFRCAWLTAVLNGLQRQELPAKSSLQAALVNVVAVTLGCLAFGVSGALAGMLLGALSQTWFLQRQLHRLRPALASAKPSRPLPGHLPLWGALLLTAGVNAVGMPVAQLAVRHALVAVGGWDAAGAWQAVARLSDTYMQFVLLFLSAFHLPRLAAAESAAARRRLQLRHAARVLPALLAVCLLVQACRSTLIGWLFAPGFAPVEDLVGWQLLGDLERAACYLLGTQLLATGHLRLAMLAELAQAALFWGLATQFAARGQALGVVQAHAATYALYFPLVLAAVAWSERRPGEGAFAPLESVRGP